MPPSRVCVRFFLVFVRSFTTFNTGILYVSFVFFIRHSFSYDPIIYPIDLLNMPYITWILRETRKPHFTQIINREEKNNISSYTCAHTQPCISSLHSYCIAVAQFAFFVSRNFHIFFPLPIEFPGPFIWLLKQFRGDCIEKNPNRFRQKSLVLINIALSAVNAMFWSKVNFFL